MTRERAKSMDQRSFWTVVHGGSAGKIASAAHGFPGTRQNASVRTVPGVHPGNVGLYDRLQQMDEEINGHERTAHSPKRKAK